MIRNDEEKEYVEKQIKKLENVLLDLKKKLLPEREEQFKAMASIYVRKIKEMREEIEEFIGMELMLIEKNDINIHIEGPVIDYGSAPISIISDFLNNFKRTIQNFYVVLNSLEYKTKIPNQISAMSDFKLIGYQPGSINLSLAIPTQQMSLFSENDIGYSVKTYFDIIKWASGENTELLSNIDDNIKEKLLINVLRTLPDNKSISRITFFGNIANDEKIIVNRSAKEKIIKEINSNEHNDKILSLKGCIRELDLDKLTFALRNIEGSTGEFKCRLNGDSVEEIKEFLDSQVMINGIDKGNYIEVKYIEII